MDIRLTKIERIPGYWRGRAWVREHFGRELARISSDTSAEAIAEYRKASEYETLARLAEIECAPNDLGRK